MATELEMIIGLDGEISFIHSDELASLFDRSETTIRRASNVEPGPDGWTADMSPIEPGVVLGPFDTRREALAAETAWIKSRMAAGPVTIHSTESTTTGESTR